MSTEPRIGVFVCHCGTNIGGVVDVSAVVSYAKTLPGVVYAEDNLYTCSEDGLGAIREKIKSHNLDRVIVASCTPRTHEPLFKMNCERAGLNRYMFEFVNLREHCSWIHMKEPEKATEKAKALVRMGVLKSRYLEPLEEIESGVNPVALVIGGGIAGMTAALNIANQHFKVHVVEKSAELGGLLRYLTTLFPTNEDGQRLLKETIERVKRNRNIVLHMPATVRDVSGYVGNFDVSIQATGGKEVKINVGTIIVATGAEEFKPYDMFGYGKLHNVYTQLEFEQMIKEGGDTFNSWKNVVLLGCVGARVPERAYCSKICCMNAIKTGLYIRELYNKAVKIFVLHRGIMALGTAYEDYYRHAMEKDIRFVRYDVTKPPVLLDDGKSKVTGVRFYHLTLGREVTIDCDLLILGVPLVAGSANRELAQMLKVPLTHEGFFLEAHVKLRPVEFATDGIFVCGCARWPTDVTEAILQGSAAAGKAVVLLRKGKIKVEAITAKVNDDKCIGCGNCVIACAYNAIELVESPATHRKVAKVNVAQCKGCGTCVAGCANGAIQQYGYTDEQLLSMIRGATGMMS